ncbi:DUF1330 domain-containing protein [Phenylobacterium sp.]|uniref:DUF1330 domain-containing protein n=1 Tax=Phenylobacterium sp. TaxID=1871053 RepID=UPI002DE98F5C|nr:DUF1330 domain-containing protein [Phenylobacterium sp.]
MSEQIHTAGPAAYVINQIRITDPDRYMTYAKAALPTIHAYGGEILVRGGAPESLAGPGDVDRVVLIRFESRQQARAWRTSPEYTAILPIREASSVSTVYVVDAAE